MLSAMPLAAQVSTNLDFTAPFPFYVGNVRMPSGSYVVKQAFDDTPNLLVIKSADGRHTASVGTISTESARVPRQSDIVFEQYGAHLYFDRVVVAGQRNGSLAETSKAEKKAEESASVAEEHSVAAYGQ
jgi:hypothetical protein